MRTDDVLRYSAFTESQEGGNPAGVVLDAHGLSDEQMLRTAARVGYSETAFLRARDDAGARAFDVRYFSPEAEVPFCGHATIAAAVAVADREGAGDLVFHTVVGPVEVITRKAPDGPATATLTSVDPHVTELEAGDLELALGLLGWSAEDLDPLLPPMIGFAGARHLVLPSGSRERLAALDYDFDGLRAFMLARDLTTVDLVWRQDETTFFARNPFPVGGVVEDPATGAAAAAFGAYLRALAAVPVPSRVTVLQGQDMGRPSTLLVDVDSSPGIRVTGAAVPIAG